MSGSDWSGDELLTVPEVADYLRLKERKIYDLVARKQIPCTRVTGKWLFPKAQIDHWLRNHSDHCDTDLAPAVHQERATAVLVGSHDPLLEWALRETDFPFSVQTGGSLEGLKRLAEGEGGLCGTHLLDADSGEYNLPSVKALLAGRDIVVLEWAKRQQGLIVAAGNPLGIRAAADLARRPGRFVARQSGSGGHVLWESLLRQAGVPGDTVRTVDTARSESDVGLSILSGKADAGLGLAAVARQLRLDFVPLAEERFDLVMYRRDYFEAPLQKLLAFCRTPAFRDKVAEMGGYDVSALGEVRYNAP